MLTFTRADANHVNFIRQVGAEVYDVTSWTYEAALEQTLSYPTYVLAEDNKPVGFVIYEVTDAYVYIGSLTISPKFQGQGYGRKILNCTLQHLRNTQCIKLNVVQTNQAALHLYLDAGFVITEPIDLDGELGYRMVRTAS